MKGRYGSPLPSYGKTPAWRKVCGKWANSRTIFSAILISLPDQKSTSWATFRVRARGGFTTSVRGSGPAVKPFLSLSWKHTGVLFLAALSTQRYSLKF